MADFSSKDTFSGFFKEASKGNLPKRVEGCKYDAENRQWVAPNYIDEYLEDGENSLLETTYLVEKSLTNRAACRNCGEKIMKDALRVAYPGELKRRDDWGAGNFYLHASCAYALVDKPPTRKFLELQYGYSKLTKSEQDEIYAGFKEAPKQGNVTALAKIKTDEDGQVIEIDGGAVQKRKLIPAKQPDTLTGANMLPFQLEGLAWMKEQEASDVKGGILADEMGMGKTIQAISLILDQRQQDRLIGPTLIICPMGAVMQWAAEIERFAVAGALSIKVFHGTDRGKIKVADLQKYDVVISTYQTLEIEYRREVNKIKVECQYCKKLFFEDKLPIHQRYFCGPDAMRTAKQKKTEKKWQENALKGMQTMGIGYFQDQAPTLSDSKEGKEAFPGIMNTFREIMAKAGKDASGISRYSKMEGGCRADFAPCKPLRCHGVLRCKCSPCSPLWYYVICTNEELLRAVTCIAGVPALNAAKDLESSSSSSSEEEEDDLEQYEYSAWNQKELKEKCKELGLDDKGKTWDLIDRLRKLTQAEDYNPPDQDLMNEFLDAKKWTMDSLKAECRKNGISCNGFKLHVAERLARYRMAMRGPGETKPKQVIDLDDADDDAVMLTRERLGVMSKKELVELCKQKEIDSKGGKADLLDRLVQLGLKSWKRSGATTSAAAGKKTPTKEDILGRISKTDLLKMKVGELRERCKEKNLATDGTKAKLVERILQGKSKVGPVETYVRGKKVIDLDDSSSSNESPQKGKKRPIDLDAASPPAKAAKGPSGKQPKVCPPCDPEDKVLAKVKKDDKGMLLELPERAKNEALIEHDLSGSVLHSVKWSRLILDEGHRIKARTNSTAMAAYGVQAEKKWCLSGTPLQNRVGELYSLVRLMKLFPFAYYGCKAKGCDCCSLHFRFTNNRYCECCGHTRMQHFSYFKQKISNPIIKFGFAGAGKDAFKTLKDDVLFKIMLRRTKKEKQEEIKLPSLSIAVRKDVMSPQEKDFYTALYTQSQVTFDSYVDGGTILHNYAHIFDLLTSLRRACDHPYLIIHQKRGKDAREKPQLPSKSLKTGFVCGLCQEDVDDDSEKVIAKCGHGFHKDCMDEYVAEAPQLPDGTVGCPVCYAPLTFWNEDTKKKKKAAVDLDSDEEMEAVEGVSAMATESLDAASILSSKPTPCTSDSSTGTKPKPTPKKKPRAKDTKSIMNSINVSEFQSSSKINALVEEVHNMCAADPTNKGLVFSQFTAMLDLCAYTMKKENVKCVCLLGSMSMSARVNALRQFKEDPSLRVMLISLKAGGEGLNLQNANHVYILDPWWNPACELQAIQRAHRIGQTKPVKALRFVTKDTIEERIIALQEKKQLVFDASVGGNAGALSRLGAQDLRFLFQN